MDELIRQWESRGDEQAIGAGWYLDLGARVLELGHPSLAYDILDCGLRYHPKHVALAYRAALSLARAGSFRSAAERVATILNELSPDEDLYEDTLSLAGRLAKDSYQRLTDLKLRKAAARESAQRYRSAFERTRDWFPGINAATMSVLAGELERGHAIAKEVLTTCSALVEGAGKNDYWLAATLGEANLLLKKKR